jgi:uncharacterized protein YndB with AHSA1/START domain
MSARNGELRYDYEIYIGSSPERVWQALADGDLTQQYAFGTRFEGRLASSWPLMLSSLKTLLESGKPLSIG